MKAKLPMTFMDQDGIRQYISESCGETIGLGHLTDLLNFAAEETTDRYALIEFNINSLCFQLDAFNPQDMMLISFIKFPPLAPP